MKEKTGVKAKKALNKHDRSTKRKVIHWKHAEQQQRSHQEQERRNGREQEQQEQVCSSPEITKMIEVKRKKKKEKVNLTDESKEFVESMFVLNQEIIHDGHVILNITKQSISNSENNLFVAEFDTSAQIRDDLRHQNQFSSQFRTWRLFNDS